MFGKKNKKNAAAAPEPRVYKAMAAKYTVDPQGMTLHYSTGATNGTGYDNEGQEMTLPAEWIERAEQVSGVVYLYLVNHGSTPGVPGLDLWTLAVGKKKAVALADDLNKTAQMASAAGLSRPFVVPRPKPKRLAEITALQRKKHPIAISFGGMLLLDGTVYYGGYAIPAAGASASIDSGAAGQSKVGVGRVLGGAVLAGPAGALIGAAAKKNTGELYITVTGEGGQTLITSGPIQDSGNATALANAIGAAS
ncbi:hypothetical protein BJF89_08635 [Corynebacterium sp. CNJ-954]|jgi:hypothetical protein|uniref:hypothetical protein n=1 Tax=Corynebacterium sp. CNJ-954 TaxID=1904962 RepID=UPI0009622B28|nr:hypothetical protein [Corynebacterium sp. CNJ-954]OLT51170.1 hypothetical protein BJF89_08635 [Corynebacterium sp. CNJ-954]